MRGHGRPGPFRPVSGRNVWRWILPGVVLGLLAGFAALALAPPAAALPIGDTLGLGETLAWTVMHHDGPACSSGWYPDASGQCVGDETGAPPAWLPVLEGPVLALDAPGPEGPMAPNPEPVPVLLLGSALAAVGWRLRRA